MSAWVLLPVAALLVACAEPVPPPIEATRASDGARHVVSRRSLPVVGAAPAQVQSIARVELATRLAGRVVRVDVHVGDRIRAGQLLGRVDDDDLIASVSAARAGLDEALARLQLARTEARRAEALHADGAFTDSALDRATSARQQAAAAVNMAQRRVESATAQRAYGDLAAPFDGVVVQRLADPGDLAAPGVPLLTVERTDSVLVVASLPERHVDRVHPGDEARVVCGSDTVAAVIHAVSADDPANRTFALRLRLPATDALRAGRFARVLYTAGDRSALWLPAAAVVQQGQLRGVRVVTGGTTMLRWLRLGAASEGGFEVLSGLASGDTIVLDAAQAGQ